MAGAFGFEKGEHYDVSIKCGERVLLPKVRDAGLETLIVSNGFSCREQIAQTTDRQAMHIAQVLKMALDGARPGLRPELGEHAGDQGAVAAGGRPWTFDSTVSGPWSTAGGNSGIGEAIALALAAAGARVAINYVTQPDAAQSVVQRMRAQHGDAEAIQADV